MLGMDSSSVSLPVAGQDKTWRVDVPMRSFQGGAAPELPRVGLTRVYLFI